MELKDVQKSRKEHKTVSITIRTFPSYSRFMKKNGISPTLIFNKTIEELMKENKE